VVFVTHDVDEALFLGDRVALLGPADGGPVRLFPVPHPRDRAARALPATTAVRRDLLAALGS
jgi:NitT/TauT family transport system ATP-binding protein